MSARWLLALLLLATLPSVRAQSWHDNSHYVSTGPRSGYYFLRPGSRLQSQLGFEAAPTIDTADPFRHGYGADALAFRFNRGGILMEAPAYIVQALPNDFYTRRLTALIRGRSTFAQVASLFGRHPSLQQRPDGFVAYYPIQVYNSFEDRSDRGRR